MSERPIVWGEHEIPDSGEPLVLRAGPLEIRVRSSGDELWTSCVHHEGAGRAVHRTAETGASRRGQGPIARHGSAGEEWTRTVTREPTQRIGLVPVFPDRPVVVAPEQSFRMVPGARARIFVRVPVTVRLVVPGPSEVILSETPTRVLSDTWWGDFREGELCYWLPISARREVRDHLFEPHLVLCPLDLSNGSGVDLEVEKFALRVAHLAILQGKRGLWSDTTKVRYRGEAEGSQVEPTGRPPEEEPEATVLTPPRTPAPTGFRARTFTRLRALRAFGGME